MNKRVINRFMIASGRIYSPIDELPQSPRCGRDLPYMNDLVEQLSKSYAQTNPVNEDGLLMNDIDALSKAPNDLIHRQIQNRMKEVSTLDNTVNISDDDRMAAFVTSKNLSSSEYAQAIGDQTSSLESYVNEMSQPESETPAADVGTETSPQ